MQRRPVLFLALGTVALSCASCTDLLLAGYRNDKVVAEYRYALGEQYLEVEGIRLCYQEYGVGEHLLIIPGLAMSIDFWQLNIPALATKYHVLAVDLPGFGKSDKPAASYELPWICDKLFAFLDAKGVRRTHLLGGSMGGQLAIMMTLSHPDRIDKVAMVGASAFWDKFGPIADLGMLLFWNDIVVTDHVRRTWPKVFPRLFHRQTPIADRIFDYQMALRADGKRFAPEGRAIARGLKSIFYNSCLDRLHEIRQPVLMVWSEEDFIHPVRDAIRARAMIRDSRLVIIPDTRHEVMMDQPEVFNRLLLAFLDGGTAAVPDSFGRHTVKL